ncbi:MAG: DHH family phosphoesterase [Candidatus Iainarchaeum archaeon]|uniref:DHH family phosphoesterase n=1 Tax=Candidatus Iainarchaeum sp. TaxID=3101447 RepID=A0A7T9DJM3_9ARCH|nr:MAG: DHH family phosphoesterase [Candidatus Diapherotrites archaeon]
MPMEISAFAPRFRASIKGKKVLCLTHAHPDLDTLASCRVLANMLPKMGAAQATFGIPEKPLLKFQALLDSFSLQPQVISTLAGFDVVVCVDFRSPLQAGNLDYALRQFAGKRILFDHHSPSAHEFPSTNTETFILPTQAATTQMVALLAEEWDYSFSPAEAELLATAIISDSARFAVANEETFRLMHALQQQSQRSYDALLLKAFPAHGLPERLATIQGMQAPSLYSAGSFLMATARAPYASTLAANALVQLGADIGIGLFRSREFVTASIRVSTRGHTLLGFDAMQVLLPLAKANGGVCGGHATAAQITFPGYVSENVLEDTCKRELLVAVRKIEKRAQLKKH